MTNENNHNSNHDQDKVTRNVAEAIGQVMMATGLAYGEQHELKFYNLRARFPDMAIDEMFVCVKVYSVDASDVPTLYEEIVAHLEHATLDDIPYSLWKEAFWMHFNDVNRLNNIDEEIQAATKKALSEREKASKLKLFAEKEWAIRRAIYRAHKKGYITYEGVNNDWGYENKDNPEKSFFGPVVFINLNPEIKEELDKAQKELDRFRFEMMTELGTHKGFGVITIDNNNGNVNDTTPINDSDLSI